mmetsp:Transcript_24262/g.29419  ORF Transcript_24262/g.29419 Transcript_24262/m.29419 type:complete len:218 (-) Transcript_24262:21-674(-)|eukprot:CAMPEP_0197866548 /NCGR_PEP_ID=MMETSP1438-20131217/44272_1 /TAXON_ID=1461541 /ORGANISM="Pterosperma sp., Strain CCMP1384" /LENGTH=217 /DNA_ID=CAMNT_0043485121 /DNA_START=326 /DNA_END=979 /DNA_ORIENTATION=-
MREEDLAAHDAAMKGIDGKTDGRGRRGSKRRGSGNADVLEHIPLVNPDEPTVWRDPADPGLAEEDRLEGISGAQAGLDDSEISTNEEIKMLMKKGDLRKEHRAILKSLEHQHGRFADKGSHERPFYLQVMAEVQDTVMYPAARTLKRFPGAPASVSGQVAALPPLSSTPSSTCSSLPTLRQASGKSSNLQRSSSGAANLPLSPLGKKVKLPQIGTPS